QHRGFGKALLAEAERIALEEFDKKKVLVISGVGAREYFRKRGYKRLDGSLYMMKRIS
ncbi:MAG: tRNA uridine(34) 5-carboxymethylaminomethyl modification radical SAM/GNAT enzyme Elp3, partial [Thermoproteota archaeon]